MDAERKVAIPRLDRPIDYQKEPHHRAPRACLRCRARKVKCSGELPTCKNCRDQTAECVYAESRKDKLKTATNNNKQFIDLLQYLSLRVDANDQEKIGRLLHDIGEEDFSTRPRSTLGDQKGKRSREDSFSEERGEAHVSGSAGSNRDVDFVNEDLLRSHDSRATGFVGPNSEIQWLKRIKTIDNSDTVNSYSQGPPGTGNEAMKQRIQAQRNRYDTFTTAKALNVSDSTYYLDDQHLDVDIAVDIYELPPSDIAQRLFSCYMDIVHTSFPIVPNGFREQFRRYFDSIKRQRPIPVPDKWQAILNLVFALGAQYSHLIQAPWRGDERDHVIYMLRAVTLMGLKDMTVISAPDLPLIQALGLLSLYYLVIGRVSRAWITIGLALRLSLAVGLHLRNEDPSASQEKKENLVRIWWSLHSVECLLCTITGRPCVIANEDCSVPRPMVLPEEQQPSIYHSGSWETTPKRPLERSSSGTHSTKYYPESPPRPPYFRSLVDIGVLSQQALSVLYSPRVSAESWETIEGLIPSLLDKLEHWASGAIDDNIDVTAPSLQQYQRSESTLGTKPFREQLLLRFYYNSTKILITRPCLCRLDQRIQKQSAASSDFNLSMAGICIQAARDMTSSLPHRPDPGYIYAYGPYWSIVHHIMQAMAVFLLEASYGDRYLHSKNGDTLTPIKKLFAWLGSMRHGNPVATRAFSVTSNLLRNSILGTEAEIQSLVTDAEKEDVAASTNSQSHEGITKEHYKDQQWDGQHSDINAAAEILHNFGAQNDKEQDFTLPDIYTDPMFWSDLGIQMPATYGTPFRTPFDQPNPLIGELGDWANWPSFSSLLQNFPPTSEPPYNY